MQIVEQHKMKRLRKNIRYLLVAVSGTSTKNECNTTSSFMRVVVVGLAATVSFRMSKHNIENTSTSVREIFRINREFAGNDDDDFMPSRAAADAAACWQ